MRVIVIFEYEGMYAEGEEADQVVEEIGKACETMQEQFGATACWVDDVEVTVEKGE